MDLARTETKKDFFLELKFSKFICRTALSQFQNPGNFVSSKNFKFVLLNNRDTILKPSHSLTTQTIVKKR